MECGSVVVGGGWARDGNLERDIKLLRYDSAVGNSAAAIRVPVLADVEAIGAWAGFDGGTQDQRPILGSRLAAATSSWRAAAWADTSGAGPSSAS